MNNEKAYWALISFMVPSLEPRAGYVCVTAASPEEVEAKIKEEVGEDVLHLVIESVSEDVPEEFKTQMLLEKPEVVN